MQARFIEIHKVYVKKIKIGYFCNRVYFHVSLICVELNTFSLQSSMEEISTYCSVLPGVAIVQICGLVDAVTTSTQHAVISFTTGCNQNKTCANPAVTAHALVW